MNDLRVSLVQTDIVWRDTDANLRQLTEKIKPLAGATDLIVLPETFTSGFTDKPDHFSNGECHQNQLISQWLLQQAVTTCTAICGSSIFAVDDGFVNRLLMATPTGDMFHYDKVHLFRMGGEHKRYQAGSDRRVVTYRGWRLLLTVCYDLRFPVFCRNRNDYDVMLCVANWPAKRRHHWRSLLMARAIENQAYVLGVNRIGIDGKGLEYSGDSMAIDCMGNYLIDDEINQPWIKTTTLQSQPLTEYRSKFPAWQDADDFEIIQKSPTSASH